MGGEGVHGPSRLSLGTSPSRNLHVVSYHLYQLSIPVLCGLRLHAIKLLCPWDSPGKNVTIPFSRGSSQPRDRTQVSIIAGFFFF